MTKLVKNYSCIIFLLAGIFNAQNVCSKDDEDLYLEQTLQIQQGNNKPFDMRLNYGIHAANDNIDLVAHGESSSTCLFYRFINDTNTHTPQVHEFSTSYINLGFGKDKKTAEESERKSLSNLPLRASPHNDRFLWEEYLSEKTSNLSPASNKLSSYQINTIAQIVTDTLTKTVRENRNLAQKALRAKAAESVKNLSLIKID